MADVLGTLSFLDTPNVNGTLVLLVGDATQTVNGTTNQIAVTGTNPTLTVGLADNPAVPGLQRIKIPAGATADRPAGTAGDLRFNTTLVAAEIYNGTSWTSLGASGSGTVLQVVTGTIPAVNTTAVIPLDNTIPTNAEGVQLWSTSFTPLSATSRIIVHYTLSTNTNTNNVSVATTVFSGATNMGATVQRCATSTTTGGVLYSLSMQASWVTGSTAAVTISARGGPLATATCYFNSHPTAFFGGTLVTEYSIFEVQ
jgi:hypothetical protein